MIIKTLVINESLLKEQLADKHSQFGVYSNILYRKIRQTHKLTLDELNQIALSVGRDTHDFLSVVEVEVDGNEQESRPDRENARPLLETKDKENFEHEMKEGYLANYDFIKKSSKEWDFTLGDGL
ncbi:MAG: hypothetical protein ACE5PV_25090 [Candidatus Poribacteria bacterium]